MFYPHFSVLSPFQCFIPISVFYPHFSVLSPFQCFILISVFYPPFQCFIPISGFYPHFSVLSPFQRFIPISVFYPHFTVLSPFSVSVFSFRLHVSAIQFQRFIPTRFFSYFRKKIQVFETIMDEIEGGTYCTRKPFVMFMGQTMLLDMRILILL